MRVAIIGAGVAGLACAERLRAAEVHVMLFDAAREPGGRTATRRVDTSRGPIAFDCGATHFTARSRAFRERVAQWQREGLAAPWLVAGRDAWVGTPSMDAPVRALAARHDVRWNCAISALVRAPDGGWILLRGDEVIGPFDAAILAVPAEPAARLLMPHDFRMARAAEEVQSFPSWTAMIAFERALAGAPPLLRDRGPIVLAVRENAKPGRGGIETWVLQASPAWSQPLLDLRGEAVARRLLDELGKGFVEPLPETLFMDAHCWPAAIPSGRFERTMWNRAIRLGACGDWLAHGFVELAWSSGDELGERVVQARAVTNQAAPGASMPAGPA